MLSVRIQPAWSAGDAAQCPECGMTCDVVDLIKRRWTKPWRNASGFNRLIMPVVVATVSPMLTIGRILLSLRLARQGRW